MDAYSLKQLDNNGQQVSGAQVQVSKDFSNAGGNRNNVGATQGPIDSISQLKEKDEGAWPPTKQHIVLLVHGSRTHGHWQERVAKCLREPNSIIVYPLGYGYFDAFSFWSPFFTRKRAIRRILRNIRSVQAKHPGAHLSIIAHSFGTYVIGKILQDNPDIHIYRLVLCGSVLSTDFRWDQVDKQIQSKIINDCSSRDIWPVLARTSTWGYGSSGMFGFKTPEVTDRFHDYRHSDYFDSSFVEKFWKPFIKNGQVIESGWDSDSNRKATPWLISLLDRFPLKYLILFSLIFVLRRAIGSFNHA